MLLSLERTEQKIWVLIILSLVTDASAASLTQGTVMMVVWQHLWFLSSLLQAVFGLSWEVFRLREIATNCILTEKAHLFINEISDLLSTDEY